MIRTTTMLAMTCVLLNGGASSAVAQSFPNAPMFAFGTAPDYWSIEIAPDEVQISYPAGEKTEKPGGSERLGAKRTVAMTTDGSAITWFAPDFRVTLTKQPCEALGVAFDYAATLTLDGKTLSGCGGDASPDAPSNPRP